MQNKDQEEEEISKCSQVKNCTHTVTTRRINVKSELNMYLKFAPNFRFKWTIQSKSNGLEIVLSPSERQQRKRRGFNAAAVLVKGLCEPR